MNKANTISIVSVTQSLITMEHFNFRGHPGLGWELYTAGNHEHMIKKRRNHTNQSHNS